MTQIKTTIDLIRHGQPQGGSLYRGHKIDDPLSELGWQQMWNAIGQYHQWQQIVSSPMLRCRAFSEKLSTKYNIPLSIEDNLKEVGFGCWEGLSREQVKIKNLTEYNNFYSDPVNNRAEGFENLDSFITRVTTCYEKIAYDYQENNILIVAHAGVIRAILAKTLQAPPSGLYKIKIENAGISRIDATKDEVLFINNRL